MIETKNNPEVKDPEFPITEERRTFELNCWRQVLLLGKLAVYRYQREEKKQDLT